MEDNKYHLRQAALELLIRIGDQGGFSHLLIDQHIKKFNLDRRDSALFTELVYGTMQRKLTLEYYLTPFLQSKKALKPWVKWLLLLALYQKIYLSRIPDHAIIHETVEIAKRKGHKGIASFVNGVMRNIQRNGVKSTDEIKDPVERLSIETSHPFWLVNRWVEMYGFETTQDMCQENLSHRPTSIRIQPMKIDRGQALEQMEEAGIKAQTSKFSGQGIKIEEGNILHMDLFKENYITIQDESSMLVAEMMALEDGMTVLDACSAPGGKTSHIAEKLANSGKIFAYDLHSKKANLVKKKLELLNLTNVEVAQADSRNLAELHPPEKFDRILVDAPCSGLGVLKGKPDIKYHKQEKDIFQLADIQETLLDKIAPLLKQDGKLMYSTCTVDKHENEEQIEKFLENHPDFEIDPAFFTELPTFLKNTQGLSRFGLQIFPQDFQTDGFFLTRLVKNT
ncbi:16S rRNA (cytosine(967)-C(5))-methyltransferase RsmB [Saliterribacillus persicus]|uniref:16S rRNA (cytosine(967)-C(5))-methyltransferase n=1 Tax=Saliterribacillus persicus TaxID=930114 RepID=A0A368XS29_9BACI|nr:16S rRNA (cytosine(967)-C(5))-methyltransferase RsmB [Saliterribacillus persicus]RCW70763.1 16S rRNA (cytosine967-C5)-methyltransferase [Saliterribacillus persicus]